MIKVRFAPSPTGYIHIGNTRIALFNWLFAKAEQGKYVLRFDDTDIERSKQEYIDGIGIDLDWLGIKPDEIYYQSKRFDRYNDVVEKLKQQGLLYPCYETQEELERRRKIRLSRKLPPIYGRESLKLEPEEIKAFEAEGRKPHWRFKLPNFDTDPFKTRRTDVHWDDVVRGPQTIDLASMSDPILIREDGSYLYTLPSVVDDIDMGITHIIRGDDHVTNTGVQIAIFEALGAHAPTFGHINLLTTISGEGLSKRKGDLSIRSLREEGFEPMAVESLAVLIGTSENVTACRTQEELLEHFDLASASKSSAKFDPADLLTLNKHIVHLLEFDEVKARLEKLGIAGKDASPFWYAVRGNIDKVNEAKFWWERLEKDGSFNAVSKEDRDYVHQSVSYLPEGEFNETSWKSWTEALKKATGRKGRALFMPLRQALTGLDHGPEMAALLPLLGKTKTLERLKA
ncbi:MULTISPECIES: glutamate--tRNA ligase [Bartonella]|uniref:glutamate--tRNA ligase n=1 Tax=Bartonella TaxID=773 RepID=UPI0018DE1635|nr:MULTISPECIES: glutamate--tRNA ligase [Bartonella]MBH9975385.1 glutamate--tRNA ligase [Bartonella choladocola]MBI0014992.1 glutamate--tRNA ligase [Bartonella sp. B10834G3]